MRSKKLLALPILLAVAIIVFILFRGYEGKTKIDPDTVAVSGNIEVLEAEASFKIPGRVTERLVDEGDEVKAGRTLARLDPSELERQVEVQAGELSAAQAMLADLEAGSRPEEIRAAAAEVQRAQAALDKLLAGSRPEEVKSADAQLRAVGSELERVKSEYERAKRLYESGVIPERDLISARTMYEAAVSRKDGLSEQKNMVVEGPRKEDIEQARAALKQATEKYALVKQGPRKQTIEQARAGPAGTVRPLDSRHTAWIRGT